MHRTNVFLTDKQRTAIQKLAKSTGLKASELIRRAIDEYLKRETK